MNTQNTTQSAEEEADADADLKLLPANLVGVELPKCGEKHGYVTTLYVYYFN